MAGDIPFYFNSHAFNLNKKSRIFQKYLVFGINYSYDVFFRIE